MKALVRSKDKVQRQFKDLNPGCVEMIEGDMTQVAGFARALKDCKVLFHTATHFRNSYKGGEHWERLYAVNVKDCRVRQVVF